MNPLRIPKHEQFAQRLATGDTQAAAYRAVYGFTGTPLSARKNAYRIARRPDVRERVAFLQRLAAEKAAWTFDQRLAFLRETILTPPADIDAHSPLCHGVKVTAHGVELKYGDKYRALILYSKLVGDFNPQKPPTQPPPVDTLAEAMARIRARRSP